MADMDDKERLKQVLLLCDQGWPLFPCHKMLESGVCSCQKRELCGRTSGKHPIFTGYQDAATCDHDTILMWWRKYNAPNFGVLTGCQNGRRLCFDVDNKVEFDANGKRLPTGVEQITEICEKYEQLPRTVTSETGTGGLHLYFFLPEGVVIPPSSGWNGGPGLDIRANGSHAIVPPSRNKGGSYTWDEGCAPWECETAVMPTWLIQLIMASNTNKTDVRTRFNTAGALMGVPHGCREEVIFHLASSLRGSNVPEEYARTLILEAASKCTPAYSADEALERLSRVYRNYAPNERRWKTDFSKDSNASSYVRPAMLPAISSTWLPPTPIMEEEEPVPFPVEALPSWLSEYVGDLAEGMQIPADCPGTLALSVLACCCAKKFEIEVKDGWQEQVNLYTVSALPPGSRKSATFKLMTVPIFAYQQEIQKEMKKHIAKMKNRRSLLEKHRDAANKLVLQKKLAKASPREIELAMKEADRLTEELEEMKIEYLPELYNSDDITPEALVTKLYEQKGKLGLFSGEGGLFEAIRGRYNSAQAIDPYLKGHAGDLIQTARKNRPDEEVHDPALTIGVTAQPECLLNMAGNEKFADFVGRGLFARFLFSYPISNIGERDTDPDPLPINQRIRYHQNIKALLELPYASDEAGESTVPWVLHFSEEAAEVFQSFVDYMEELQAPGGALRGSAFMEKWAPKAAGAVGRISALLHVAANVNEANPADLFVQAQTVENACVLMNYFIHHAIRTYGLMCQDGSEEVAVKIIDWLKAYPRDTFLFQEIVAATKVEKGINFKALELLRNHGYIKIASTDRSNPQYDVNPIWIEQFKPPPTPAGAIASAVEEFAATP